MANQNSKKTKKAPLTHWLLHHKDSAKKTLTRISSNFISFTFTSLLIAIAFAIPMGLYAIFTSIDKVTNHWDSDKQITLFLSQSLALKDANNLADKIAKQSSIQSAYAIDKETVLKDFQKQVEFDISNNLISENPLPHIVVVTPAENVDLDVLKDYLTNLKPVEHVQFDLLWFQRLQGISNFILTTQQLMTVLLLICAGLIIANVTRWEISSRKDEIEIIKLIGATDAYVMRPFLYYGLYLGLTGVCIAIIIVSLSTWLTNLSLDNLSRLFNSDLHITTLPISAMIILTLAGCFLGIVSAWLAAKQKLKLIN